MLVIYIKVGVYYCGGVSCVRSVYRFHEIAGKVEQTLTEPTLKG